MASWKKRLVEGDAVAENLATADLTSTSAVRTFSMPDGASLFRIQNGASSPDDLLSLSNAADNASTVTLTGGIQLVEDGAGNQGCLKLFEGGGSSNYVCLMANGAATADQTITFPAAGPGAANKILESDASGNLSWIDTPSGGSDTHLGNADLTANANRTYDADGNSLTIDINGGDFTLSDSSSSDTYLQASNNVLELGDGAMTVQATGKFYADGGIEHDEANLTAAGAYGAGSEITFLGSSATATTAGRIYYYNGTTWAFYSSATEAHQKALLGIAIGTTMSKGFLLKGFVNPNGATNLTTASPVYGATNASATTTAPTSGYQRVMGHSISTSLIFFNPSQEYIDLA